MNDAEIRERLARLEQKVNALLVISGADMGRILGKGFTGYNALSAFEEFWKQRPDYLRQPEDEEAKP